MVVQAFRNDDLVPWQLKNEWLNCTALVRHMNFVVGHIFREDNACADMLASIASSFVGGSLSLIFWQLLIVLTK